MCNILAPQLNVHLEFHAPFKKQLQSVKEKPQGPSHTTASGTHASGIAEQDFLRLPAARGAAVDRIHLSQNAQPGEADYGGCCANQRIRSRCL